MKDRLIYKIEGISLLRVLGSVVIVFGHVWIILLASAPILQPFSFIMANMDSFVRMFFMLSSFCMLCGYEQRLFTDDSSIKKFYLRRIMKIAPIFYIMIAISVILSLAFKIGEFSVAGTLSSLSLMFSMMPHFQDSIVSGGWSVGIEWIFYMVFPLFVIVTRNKKLRYSLFFISLLIFLGFDQYIGGFAEMPHVNFVRYLPYFLMGSILYFLVPSILKLKEKIGSATHLIALTTFAIGLLLWRLNRDFGMLFVFSSMIFEVIHSKNKLFSYKPIKKMAEISYPVYLIHLTLIIIIANTGIHRYFIWNWPTEFSLIMLGGLLYVTSAIMGYAALKLEKISVNYLTKAIKI